MQRFRNSLSRSRGNPEAVTSAIHGLALAAVGGDAQWRIRDRMQIQKVNKEKVNENEEATGNGGKECSQFSALRRRKTTMKTRVGQKRTGGYPPEGSRGGTRRRRWGAGEGGGGRRRMKGEKKEETGEAKAGNLDRVDHPLEPRALWWRTTCPTVQPPPPANSVRENLES
jgi:hypothetical protein